MLRIKHVNALNRFALRYGHAWRRRLLDSLADGKPMPGLTSAHDVELLREMHALTGLRVIANFKPIEGGYAKVGCLRKDYFRKLNSERLWLVNAWRLVDHRGSDVVLPWSRSRKEARELGRAANVYIIED
jgi:hypothetical protein